MSRLDYLQTTGTSGDIKIAIKADKLKSEKLTITKG